MTCDDFKTVFIKTPLDPSCQIKGAKTVIQTIYKQIAQKYKAAGPDKAEFLGTPSFINGMKDVLICSTIHIAFTTSSFRET